MDELSHKTAQLIQKTADDEVDFITGKTDLLPLLIKCEELYDERKVCARNLPSPERHSAKAGGLLQDSALIKVASNIITKKVRNCQVDTLQFNPLQFLTELVTKLDPSAPGDEDVEQNNHKLMWRLLGMESHEVMCPSPPFDFVYGTFDLDPIEVAKRKRRKVEKDAVSQVTKPLAITAEEASSNKMMLEAKKVLKCFRNAVENSTERALGYYEFVVDPRYFKRSVENMFLVSSLIKLGHLAVIEDVNELPCLKLLNKEKGNFTPTTCQIISSMSMEMWKELIEVFNIKKALILSTGRKM